VIVFVMAPHAAYPVELRHQVFLGSRAVAAGLLTRRQLDGQRWRRINHDVFADAALAVDHLLFVRAAALLMPPGAVINGQSAAHVWGASMAVPDQPVQVWTPVPFGPVRGVRIHRAPTRLQCVTEWRELPICTPAHAAWDIARTMPAHDAMEWIDALARRRRLSRADLNRHGALHSSGRGHRRAATTLGLADPRAESPPESRVRVAFAVAGLPTPIPQFTVLDADGYFLARVDFAWPWLRFAAEYDGQWHADRDQLTRDRRRLRDLTAAGWQVYHITRDDLKHLDRLAREIQAALRRRAAELSK
jgi:hypothetical protein